MSFSQKQVEDLIALALDTEKKLEEKPTVVGYDNTKTMKIYVGLSSNQFESILRLILPSLLEIYKDPKKAKTALYMYLMKLKTGLTCNEIAPLFKVNPRIVMSRVRKVRQVLHREFVPIHLFNWSRQDLLRNTSALSRRLYKISDETAVITLDGTYIYTISSSNYNFQKESYSMQKRRNLVKFMMAVATNGMILGAYGPFSAGKNDATILNEIMSKTGSIFDLLLPGDVVVVDRGFRDCIRSLKRRELIVKIPAFIGRNKSQFTTKQANTTRNATKTRFVVEVRNGHVKRRWKQLGLVQMHQSIPHLRQDFQIAVALLNAFSKNVLSDKDDWNHIANVMITKAGEKNDMMRFVKTIPKAKFSKIHNLSLFPKLSYADLKNISQGTYQINQARSYVQMHLKNCDNNFEINVCNATDFKTHCARMSHFSNPLLLMVNLPSRFVSGKKHQTYVLLNDQNNVGYTVEKFCCTCKSGTRTVGCCSHVMCIIWYTLHVDQTKLRLPSPNLNNIFE